MKSSSPMAAATATAILALLPAATFAQQASPPTTQRQPLEVGQERAGLLTPKDSVSGSERRAQSWALKGRRGRLIVLDLISTQFDPSLEVVGPGIPPLGDDDSGGACNARVSFTPPEDGIYWVLVQGTASSSEGAFTLRASRAAGPMAHGDCTAPVAARFGPVDLAAVPLVGVLGLGDAVHGELTSQDRRLKDGYAKAYELHATRGASLTIDLSSSAFDAYLAITGPGLDRALEDDDSGGGCDARIRLAVPADGVYRVIVTSANEGETGRFMLKASTEPTAVTEHPCDEGTDAPHGSTDISPDELTNLAVQGTIRVGDDIAGELKSDTPTIVDGTHALVWTIVGAKGKTVIVDLVSEDFDGYLMVTGAGLDNVLDDDDSGGACNPRLALTFPADGTYRLVVNTVDRGATGKFHLIVGTEKRPTATGSCPGDPSR